MQVGLTLAEAATILDPPVTERQLHLIVRALSLPAAGKRRTGRSGAPALTYDAALLMRVHTALVPFLPGSVL